MAAGTELPHYLLPSILFHNFSHSTKIPPYLHLYILLCIIKFHSRACYHLYSTVLSTLNRNSDKSEQYNKLVNITKTKQIHRYREHTNGCQREEGMGSGKIGVGE